jgi:hypothetical protein
MRSKSEVVGTVRSLAQFLESIKNRRQAAIDRMFGQGKDATWPACRRHGVHDASCPGEAPALRGIEKFRKLE